VSLALAAAVAGSLAFVGRVFGWLTIAGSATAALVGTVVLAGAGFLGAALLGMFFVSGSLLTKLSARADQERLNHQPGGRTPRQVLANGGWAVAGAMVASVSDLGWPILAGSLAAAQADTWATEIGAYSRKPTKLITSWQNVPPGTSGGITTLGTLGGAMGAGTAAVVSAIAAATLLVGAAALLGGLAGMTADSVLGATVQAKYICPSCGQTGEVRVHSCGRPAKRLSGWEWIDNDTVNFIATGVGAAIATAVWAFR